jgi:hypothetical protein
MSFGMIMNMPPPTMAMRIMGFLRIDRIETVVAVSD